MERNIREFLRETGAAKLADQGALSAHRRYNYLLQGANVTPLVKLMRDRGVSKLVSHNGKWFLTAEGTFGNPKSGEAKQGPVKNLAHLGNVFRGQNAEINPYFEPIPEDCAARFESSSSRPFARITFDRHLRGGKPGIRDLPVTVGDIVEMIGKGHSFSEVLQSHPGLEAADIQEALGYAAKRVSQVNTYLFRPAIEQEDDGRWSADIPILPGCAAWGYTRQEALETLKIIAQDFLEVIEEFGDKLPAAAEEESRSLSGEIVTVSTNQA